MAKLESVTREIAVIQRARTAGANAEAPQARQSGQKAEDSGEESEEMHQDLPDAPINATEPYEALISSLQADVKRLEAAYEKSTRGNTELEQELADLKSSASEQTRVLQGSLEESWER
jgi:predicted RNase H-like nuclease (RuvC/YqgF family)|eukprot:COSAG02_NODE_1272_length_13523_cov_3.824866_11_plen_118_part_00